MSPPFITRAVTTADHDKISALYGLVFGPGRFARAAYRVREGTGFFSRFCRVVDLNGRIVAAVRITEISIGGTGGAALLGPLAVDPSFRGRGCGSKLIADVLADLKKAGIKLVVLVGDAPFYGRFGFTPVPPGQIRFPGPVDPNRVLAAEIEDAALSSYRGVIAAATPGFSGKG